MFGYTAVRQWPEVAGPEPPGDYGDQADQADQNSEIGSTRAERSKLRADARPTRNGE
jgi:hypothetical protein